jgi:O-methyltransferase
MSSLLHPAQRKAREPVAISDADRGIVERCLPYTLTSPQRLLAVIDSVRYLVRRELPGALVECGVWRGGSVLAMILTLQELGVTDREIFLYDTFTGMTAPGEEDISAFDRPALESWREARHQGESPWGKIFNPDVFSRHAVESTLAATGYPSTRLRLVEGDVLQTLPSCAPGRVALLRLDTDWYASTRHELEHLYPRLAHGAVMIVDDYGHWDGARRAVDEYLGERGPLLHRIDYTGRVAVKD